MAKRITPGEREKVTELLRSLPLHINPTQELTQEMLWLQAMTHTNFLLALHLIRLDSKEKKAKPHAPGRGNQKLKTPHRARPAQKMGAKRRVPLVRDEDTER